MAPIPSRLPEEALSLISSAERRYKRIVESAVPELRRCIGPLSMQQTLAEDVREETVALTRQIEALDTMVDDQPGEKNRRELRELVNDFQQKLDSLRKDTRAALLASKRTIDSRTKSNRDELLAFSSILTEKQTSSEKTTEDAVMKANSDVTDALRRTIALMQSELERSVLSTQLLDDSTASLRSTSSQHDTLNGVMSTSKQLVTALEKSDWLDRILILSAFVFFILVVLFILKQRIVDRGIRIAFWWTRFIPSFSDDSELLRNAEKDMASAVAEASSSLSAAAASLASVVIPVASLSPSLAATFSTSPDIPEPSPVTSEAWKPSPTPSEAPIPAEETISSIENNTLEPNPVTVTSPTLLFT
ncbi:Sec20-domain-containing protein [Flammula alnicola]|nr:Sec20-domain-containing protein [Flammula alnicola]